MPDHSRRQYIPIHTLNVHQIEHVGRQLAGEYKLGVFR